MAQTGKHYGFSQVPRQVLRGEKYKTGKQKLSLIEKGLYTCLKDICGEAGECYYTQRNLATEIGTSASTLTRYIPKLKDKGLIYAEKKMRGTGANRHEIWHIRIVDIWKENDDLYRSQDCCNEKQSSVSDRNKVANTSTSVSNGNENPKIVSDRSDFVSSSNEDCFYLTDRIITSNNNNLNEKEDKVTSVEKDSGNQTLAPDVASLLSSLLSEIRDARRENAEIKQLLASSKQEPTGDTNAQKHLQVTRGSSDTMLSNSYNAATNTTKCNTSLSGDDTHSTHQYQSPATRHSQQEEVTNANLTPSPSSTRSSTPASSSVRDNPSTEHADTSSCAHGMEDIKNVEQKSIQDKQSNPIAKGTTNERKEEESIIGDLAIRDALNDTQLSLLPDMPSNEKPNKPKGKNKNAVNINEAAIRKQVHAWINEKRGYPLQGRATVGQVINENKAVITLAHMLYLHEHENNTEDGCTWEELNYEWDYLSQHNKYWRQPDNRKRIGAEIILRMFAETVHDYRTQKRSGSQTRPVAATPGSQQYVDLIHEAAHAFLNKEKEINTEYDEAYAAFL